MQIDLREGVEVDRQSFVGGDFKLRSVLQRVWGYSEFLPLQLEAMQSVLSSQDALVVMPTGGGKSLCFQAPALCRTGLALVVSPLIALMKDQVDGLRECGMSAAAIHSGLSADERRAIAARIGDGSLKFLYVAPERLLADTMLEFLRERPITLIAIDEAHCISSWGHDFRPEYRELWRLGEVFPGVPRLALTATATCKVRDDIVGQLRLANSRILVGDFRRSNLTYHVARRAGGPNQVCSVLDRHRDSAGIVYCISRCDATLKDIARRRPSTIKLFLFVHGVGERKAQQYGDNFLSCVADYCQRADVPLDPVTPGEAAGSRDAGHHAGKATGAAARQAFELFEQGMDVEQVAELLQRARSTTYDYLEAYIEHAKLTDATRWCDAYEILRIETVADYVDDHRLKPIHTALHGAASYDMIRIVLACKRNRLSRR